MIKDKETDRTKPMKETGRGSVRDMLERKKVWLLCWKKVDPSR